jgi:hypothetical protein
MFLMRGVSWTFASASSNRNRPLPETLFPGSLYRQSAKSRKWMVQALNSVAPR